jgi:hypothetical protein
LRKRGRQGVTKDAPRLRKLKKNGLGDWSKAANYQEKPWSCLLVTKAKRGRRGAAAAVATIFAIESRRIIVVVGDWLEERIRKNRERDIEKARQTGRDEGRTEAQKTQEERVRRLVESGQLAAEALELFLPDDDEAKE